MEPAVTVGIVWMLFGVTHVGLAACGIRGRLVASIGERGFTFLFSGIAAVLVTVLVASYAGARSEGASGPALGRFPVVRPILVAAIGFGVVLMTASFATYDRSPYAVLGTGSFPTARGIERVTRHAFFAGLVVFALAHALLATRLVGTVFLAGYAVVAIVGSRHQDRKLLARLGRPFAEYLRTTSAVPFAAILAGRQRLVWGELPYRAIAVGLVLAFALRAAHPMIFAHGGLLFLGALFGGIGAIFVGALRRANAERSLRAAGAFARVPRDALENP